MFKVCWLQRATVLPWVCRYFYSFAIGRVLRPLDMSVRPVMWRCVRRQTLLLATACWLMLRQRVSRLFAVPQLPDRSAETGVGCCAMESGCGKSSSRGARSLEWRKLRQFSSESGMTAAEPRRPPWRCDEPIPPKIARSRLTEKLMRLLNAASFGLRLLYQIWWAELGLVVAIVSADWLAPWWSTSGLDS